MAQNVFMIILKTQVQNNRNKLYLYFVLSKKKKYFSLFIYSANIYLVSIRYENWRWSSNTLATWYKEGLIGKDPDVGKDWRQEQKKTEDEMDGITDSVDKSLSKFQQIVKDRES